MGFLRLQQIMQLEEENPVSAWTIKCTHCGENTHPIEIDDLVKHHIDDYGWFRCEHCLERGYIEKVSIYLHRFIQPIGWDQENEYQPFIFTYSDELGEYPSKLWIRYYKNHRQRGGKLKVEVGPMLDLEDLLDMIGQIYRKDDGLMGSCCKDCLPEC